MSVIDANGKEAVVGDNVFFGQGSKGAQELIGGVITKVNDKTVTITFSWTGYDDATEELNRKSKCFVIV